MAKLFFKNSQFNWLVKMSWLIEAGMLKLLWIIVSPMKPEAASITGRKFMSWLGPRTKKHKHVLANLRIVCPNKTADEIDLIGKAAWGNLGAVLAEFPHMPSITNLEADSPSIEIVNKNTDPVFLAHEKPCIFIAAHLGNWEISGFAIQANGFPTDLVYSPFENTTLENMVQANRTFMKTGFITKVNALRRMHSSLKKGRSVGLHVDVRVDGGELYPLFDVDATTTTAPAWLALKTGCDLVPMVTERVGDAKFRVVFHPAISLNDLDVDKHDKRAAIAAITVKMNQAIERLIVQHPEHWLCTKRRWPKNLMRSLNAYR
ncbi:MAG: lysophospholipid acyltransferase family protein [Gammaproteobacteria bacterium]